MQYVLTYTSTLCTSSLQTGKKDVLIAFSNLQKIVIVECTSVKNMKVIKHRHAFWILLTEIIWSRRLIQFFCDGRFVLGGLMYARKIWTYHITVLIVYVYGMHLQSSFFVVLKLFTGVEIQTSRERIERYPSIFGLVNNRNRNTW